MVDMDYTRAEARVVASQLTEEQIAVVHSLMEEVGQGPGHIAATTRALGVPVTPRRARTILQELRTLGVVDFGYLMSEDGFLRGRGYWLDTFGRYVREVLEETE